MTQNPPPRMPPHMPPVPRDYEDASFSEMVPFQSSKISIWRSPLTVVLGIAALITPFLLGTMQALLASQNNNERMGIFVLTTIIAVFFILMLMQIGIYFYSRPGRSVWPFMWPFAAVAIILSIPILSQLYFFVFRDILPGDVRSLRDDSGFFMTFIAMFFGAGLCEELMKATPILISAGITLHAQRSPASPSALVRFFQIRGPLDGALMGIFAGGGFILIETALEYVPGIANQVAQQTNDAALGFTAGLMLLLPRVFGGVVGHMAYSAIFGYFIGLAIIRRRKFWQLILGGWIAASLVHALWNSVDQIAGFLYYVVAAFAAVFAAGVILKARQIHQSLHGAPAETDGSIIIDRRPGAPAAAFAGAAPGFPAAAPPVFPPMAPPAAPQPAAAPPPEARPQELAIDVDGLLIPVRAGGGIDLGAEPALGGRGAGVKGSVVAHPSRPGILGLRNSGDIGWTAHLRDGSTQRIERDQNVRLAPGVRIDFGDGLFANVVARG